jgi:acyl carrier protein
MEELMEILRELRPDVDFERETALIDDGILGSFDITALVNEIMDVFDVTISMADLEPENFNSAEAIYDYIQSLKD